MGSGLIAALAALAASVGDCLMLAVAHGDFKETLGNTTTQRLVLSIGGMLGVLFVPFYALGYSASTRLIAPTRTELQWSLRIAGICAATFATITHGLTMLEVDLLVRSGDHIKTPLEILERGTTVLSAVATMTGIFVVTASALFVYSTRCWTAHTNALLPASLNPVFVVIVLTGISWPSMYLQTYLAPAALNLGHFMFFVACASKLRLRNGQFSGLTNSCKVTLRNSASSRGWSD